VPWRAKAAEEELEGRLLTPETAAKAAAAALAGAAPMEQNGYKVMLFRGMLEEELVKLGKR
jgi:xanthine dehydrogenase YagS FAD-binding subunit